MNGAGRGACAPRTMLTKLGGCANGGVGALVWSLALVLGTNFVLNGVPHVSGAVVSFGVETSIDKGLGPIGGFAPEPIPSCGDVWITWHGYGADGISRQWAYAVSADGSSQYPNLTS